MPVFPKIPVQEAGDCHDTISMRCFNDTATAKKHYSYMKQHLFAVHRWHLMDDMPTKFRLVDKTGQEKQGVPETGDYIRIDIPGPGNPAGDGSDWVRIGQLQQEEEADVAFVAILVHVAPPPDASVLTPAHFFGQGASSTFVVRRIGTCIQAEVHGRNEVNNTKQGTLSEKVRNGMVAAAAKMGLGKVQWKIWTEGMIAPIPPRLEDADMRNPVK